MLQTMLVKKPTFPFIPKLIIKDLSNYLILNMQKKGNKSKTKKFTNYLQKTCNY